MKTQTQWFVLTVPALLLVLTPGCGDESAGSPQSQTEHSEAGHEEGAGRADEVSLTPEAIDRYAVKVADAAKRALVPTILAPARVSYNTEAVAHVGSPLRGRVAELRARLGAQVTKGDPLLIIESPELGQAQSDYLQKRAAVRSAGPAVQLAKNSYERAKALYEKSQGIALTDVQQREAEYRAAEAALLWAQTAATGAENTLHLFGMAQDAVDALVSSGEVAPRFAITAPLDGQVIEREVTLGELVSPEKETLLTIADLRTLWVLADVPEARLPEIEIGARVRVSVGTGEDASFSGSVAFISPAVDPSTRAAQVRVEVQQEHLALRPGMFARAQIETTRRATGTVVAVPDEAVQTVEGRPSVFVPVPDKEGTFAVRPLVIGRSVGNWVPVVSGLKEGEPYVVSGSFVLKAELGKGSASHDD